MKTFLTNTHNKAENLSIQETAHWYNVIRVSWSKDYIFYGSVQSFMEQRFKLWHIIIDHSYISVFHAMTKHVITTWRLRYVFNLMSVWLFKCSSSVRRVERKLSWQRLTINVGADRNSPHNLQDVMIRFRLNPSLHHLNKLSRHWDLFVYGVRGFT